MLPRERNTLYKWVCCSDQSLMLPTLTPGLEKSPGLRLLLFRVKGEPAQQGLKGTFKWLQESEKKRGEQEATSVLGNCMSHTGVELYLKCFTKRNDPITRNYQHVHGKIMNSNSRANQLNFLFKKIKMTLNWSCCLPRCRVPCFPSDIFVCWIGPAAWNSEPRSAELSLPKQRLEMTCWRIKSDLRTRDASPVLPCPRTMVEPNHESLTTIRFQTDLGHFMKVKTPF